MNRVALARLDITNGTLPTASLEFKKGLNVISGIENRGKTYAFKCIDFLLGKTKPPKKNRHSGGYAFATIYFTISDKQRGAVSREFETTEAYCLPFHGIDEDVPEDSWAKLAKTHGAKKESISGYWMTAFGIEPSMLRASQTPGDMNALTIRYLAHLILIDELRIIAERSTGRTEQATGWTAEGDMFAHMIGARKNPPKAVEKKVEDPALPAAVRDFILQEVGKIEERLKALPSIDGSQDEAEQIAKRAQDFTITANDAAVALQEALSQIEAAHRELTESRAKTKVSREISVRLELLQQYYQTDLKRLEAVSETAFLLDQLSTVPCPTCLQPFVGTKSVATGDNSKEYIQKILEGAKVEATKIRQLEHDLTITLEKSRDDYRDASSSENKLTESLERLRRGAKAQQDLVEKSRTQLADTFTALGPLAERRALRQRKSELLRQIPGTETEPMAALSIGEKTDFDSDAIKGFCDTVKGLLEEWKWNYTDPPLEVTFNEATTDILISGEERDSFGKAVRAIISSAFIIGLMDYCYSKGLPHPGFVVLDSPLTTKRDNKKAEEEEEEDEEQVSDDILTAFFTHLARNYSDRQVVIFDNKEPPAFLYTEINHIRFNDPPISNRKGLFPSS